MTQFLPPNLLALFAPRDPMPFLPPTDKLPHEKKRVNYTGIAEYASLFEDPKDTPLPTKVETKDERKERKRRERAELQAYKIEQGIAMWDPNSNSKATSDPYKTLFVSRINYDTSESKLRREFEVYGPIRKIAMAYVKGGGKPRGYAFIEYEHERDMHAYKHADGLKIDGRRVLVDVERGRTVKGWLPRRLGGGLGNSRRPKGPGGEFLDELRSHSREKSRESSQRRGFGSDRGDRQERRRSRSRDRSNVGNDRKRRSRSRSPDRDRRDRGDDRRSARGNGKEDRAGREERNRDDRGSRDTRERRDKDRRSERVSRDDNQSTESRGANNGDY